MEPRKQGRRRSSRRDSAPGDVIQSIKRESFLESYGIKEEEEDARSVDSLGAIVSANANYNNRKRLDERKSLTLEDLDDSDIDHILTYGGSSGAVDFTESLLEMEMSKNSLDILEEEEKSQEDPFGPSRRQTTDSQTTPPPNFAGGGTRRKGDKKRRMQQRLGNYADNRRASTGTINSSSFAASCNESFGESLASFTSLNSFSSSVVNGNGSGTNAAVGNLVFVTDEEMEKIMYGDDPDRQENGSPERMRRNSTLSVSSNLSNSLPPTSILGTGAFSTVRLAWRKTPSSIAEEEEDQIENAVDKTSSFLNGAKEDEEERGKRRSVVRVQSQNNDVDLKNKGQLVAVKIIQKSILKQMKTIQKGDKGRVTVLTAFDNIEREIATMKRLKHPNLVGLFEVIDSIESDRMHMVLEYVKLGEILSHVEGTNKYKRMRFRKKVRGLTEDGHFDEKHAALYFVDIMHGLAYLHRNRICHRDLKPENILLCENGIAKISDFGVAHMFEDERARESYMQNALDDESLQDLLSDCEGDDDILASELSKTDSTTRLSQRESDLALAMTKNFDRGFLKKTEGTWCFWSPEMCGIDSKGFSGYASDLWAAGICLYIFATGTLPFFSMVPSDLFDMIAKAEVQYEGLGLSDELKDLLGKMLHKEPSTRAGVGECLKHKFCSNARIERIDELGEKFDSSEKHIILSKNDVDTALSVTMPKRHNGLHRKIISKRFSAPDVIIPNSISEKDEKISKWQAGLKEKATEATQSIDHLPEKKKKTSLTSKIKSKILGSLGKRIQTQ